MRKMTIVLVLSICFIFSAVSSIVYAGNNPLIQITNGAGAILTSPAQPLYKVPKENVEKHGWAALVPGIVKGLFKFGTEIAAGAADIVMPFGEQQSEGCAFSNNGNSKE
ncbi:MAG: hypothetical protein AAB890_02775 [Patescibacteria group bacterium]